MHVFIGSIISSELAQITGEESFHAVKVLRLKVNEKVSVIDGKGNMIEGSLIEIHEKNCFVKIEKQHEQYLASKNKLHIAIAPTKNIERIEWMLEKCVEIGIDEMSFINCHRSERKVIKLDRLQKIAESAVKQSKQAYLPKLNDLVKFNDFVASTTTQHKLIAHCEEDKERLEIHDYILQQKNNNTSSSYLFLVGPEGDFSPDEISLALSKDFKPLSLGKTRLRTETAGLLACSAFSFLNA